MNKRDRRKFGMQKYLDVMREALNKNIDKHVTTSWRGHRSLQGWCSMNYPSTLSNPMLKRRPNPINPESIKFSNLNKPITAPQDRVRRPLTAITQKGKRVGHPLPIKHNFYNASKAELLNLSDSENEESATESVKLPVQTNVYTNQPYNLTKYHAPQQIYGAMGSACIRSSSQPPVGSENPPVSLGFAYTKKSAAMLTTTDYDEKVKIMNELNRKSQYLSPLKPMATYCGPKPDPKKDPYNRRKVKQLDDISFEPDDEPEEVKNFRRLPDTVLTEENLKVSLTKDLRALNINDHFWLKNNFIDKIGRMAPNLVELSIRGLKVTTEVFEELVKHMGLLKILDISNCKLIEDRGIVRLAETNQGIVSLKASGCQRGITDTAIKKLLEYSRCQLELLDINYCNQVTNVGLKAFHEHNETQVFRELYLNGLNKCTNEGFSSLLLTCTKTLILLHMALNDQYELTGEVCKAIGKCFELQILDLTGWKTIGDDGLNHLASGSIQGEEKPILVGLKNLEILKLNNLDMINDSGLIRLLKISNSITHLEISSWINITDYFFTQIPQVTPKLEFLDMNMIPSMVPKIFDEFKENNPKLNIRRFMIQEADVKDNGLRRPLKIKGKKPKKGKKKGKKKKK